MVWTTLAPLTPTFVLNYSNSNSNSNNSNGNVNDKM
jgi:hypothetical protein